MASLVKSNSCRNHHFRHFSKSSSQLAPAAREHKARSGGGEGTEPLEQRVAGAARGRPPERKAELGSIKDLKNAT